MENIIINQSEIKRSKAGIEKIIEDEIIEVNKFYYNKLKHAFQNSEGDYIKKIKLQVEEEYKLVNELANLYKETLQYIQEAAEDAEWLDKTYSIVKILEEK